MATTVHAGPSWASALQSASNTAGSYRRATQETEQHRLAIREGEQQLAQGADEHEMRKRAFEQNAKLIQLRAEGEELEQMIRLDQHQQDMEAASVRGRLIRGALNPEQLLKDAEGSPDELAGILEDASPEDRALTFQALAVERESKRQTEEAFQLGSSITKQLAHAGANTGEAPYMPGYLEGLQALQQELMTWQPGQGRDPAEMRAEAAELEQENDKFQIEHDAINAGLKDLEAQYGNGPEYAVARAKMRKGDLDGAADEAYRTKNPEAWKKTRADAQAEVISETRRELADMAMAGAFDAGREPGTPEWDAYMDSYYTAARRLYGPDVVPYTEQEQFDQEIQAFIAAGVPEEEAFQAIQAGLTYEEWAASAGPKGTSP